MNCLGVAQRADRSREAAPISWADEPAVDTVAHELGERADPRRDHGLPGRLCLQGHERERLVHERRDDEDV